MGLVLREGDDWKILGERGWLKANKRLDKYLLSFHVLVRICFISVAKLQSVDRWGRRWERLREF